MQNLKSQQYDRKSQKSKFRAETKSSNESYSNGFSFDTHVKGGLKTQMKFYNSGIDINNQTFDS